MFETKFDPYKELSFCDTLLCSHIDPQFYGPTVLSSRKPVRGCPPFEKTCSKPYFAHHAGAPPHGFIQCKMIAMKIMIVMKMFLDLGCGCSIQFNFN